MKVASHSNWLCTSAAIMLLSSCGTRGGVVAASAAGTGGGASVPQAYTMVVAEDGELPACSTSNKKQLVYVKSTGTFKSCEDGAWSAIEIGGLRVVSNSLLTPYATNICTFYSSFNSCYFRGGQLVKYSDGSVLLTGAYTNFYMTDAPISSEPEYDRNSTSISFLIPAAASYGYQLLDESVARGNGDFKNLYLVYVKSTDVVAIVFDSNDDGDPDLSDEIVHNVARTNW